MERKRKCQKSKIKPTQIKPIHWFCSLMDSNLDPFFVKSIDLIWFVNSKTDKIEPTIILPPIELKNK